MSNSKSRRLARLAGSHKVFLPTPTRQIGYAEIERHKDFITVASGQRSVNAAIHYFYEILLSFHSNPSILDFVSKRTGLKKRAALNKLIEFRTIYQSKKEIEKLFHEPW